MRVAAAEEPRHSETQWSGFQLLHAIPGRLRVHLPEWSGKRRIEAHLRQVQGVHSVQANPLTGNILIQYDPTVMNEQSILKEVQAFDLNTTNEPDLEPPPPPVVRDKPGRTVRARIAVRGLDRDPQIAKRVLEHLQRYQGVRASVNRLTGRVLVEFTEHEVDLEHLISQVTALELPEIPEEDRPAYPLDPGPLIQGAFRTIESTIGLGLLAVRRLVGFQEPLPGSGAALQIASMIGILQSIPPGPLWITEALWTHSGRSAL
jgi:cation-transporting ATPase I